MPKIVSDGIFDEVTLKDIKNTIARAFNELSANLRFCSIERDMDEKSIQVVRRKADGMKNELSRFIDYQVEMIEKENQLL